MSGTTPDITPAQVLAVLAGVLTQLVNAGFVNGKTDQLVIGLAGIVVPFAWIIADAIIRHGRSRALLPQAHDMGRKS